MSCSTFNSVTHKPDPNWEENDPLFSEMKAKRGWESLKSGKRDFLEKVNLTVKCPFDLVTCWLLITKVKSSFQWSLRINASQITESKRDEELEKAIIKNDLWTFDNEK